VTPGDGHGDSATVAVIMIRRSDSDRHDSGGP
jgi:hypothetical protein